MKAATEKMQAKTAEVGQKLSICSILALAVSTSVLAAIEEVRRQLEIDHPEVKERCDRAEVEQLFSAFYTTEMERDVLHAALAGRSCPWRNQRSRGTVLNCFEVGTACGKRWNSHICGNEDR